MQQAITFKTPKFPIEPRLVEVGDGLTLPLYASRAQAGFPSPADDYISEKIDLNVELIQNPSATFLVRASGDSMRDARIYDGDLLIVDRSVTPTHGKIIIAVIDTHITIKRLMMKNGKPYLNPANPEYPPIAIDPEQGIMIWGVVMHGVQSF